MIAALSAVIVGVCALLVALYQAQLMRSQQAAEVWPHVAVGWSSVVHADQAEFSFLLRNSGVGPARIRWAEVRLDEVPVKSWHALGAALTDTTIGHQVAVSHFNGRVLVPGESVTIVEVL